MGRVNGYSTVTENEKPNKQQEPGQQSTPPQPLAQASEPQLHPYVEYSEPQPQPQPQQQEVTTTTAQPQIYIQPQIIIQPQIQVPPPPTYVQAPPVGSGYYTYPAQECHHPEPIYTPQQYHQGWSTGLFDCLEDPENAIITLCCPCVTFGQVAEMLDNGGTSCETAGCVYTAIACVIACPCIYSCTYRTKLRSRFGLDESPASDCITHLCCEYCALCQEYRELNQRGLNPSAGWMNISRNQSMHQQQQYQQHGMVAPGYQTMQQS